MSQIKIKNFGPIKEGFGGGWMDIKKVTVFIGNQGSGKSTVAKLISTLSWIEKAMVKGVLRHDELNTYNRFVKQLAYQRIDDYIKPDTVIEYNGRAFLFSFMDGIFKATKKPINEYSLPQIMYVPSERNILSVFDRPDRIKNIPRPLFTFNEEFDAAKDLFGAGLELPINKANFAYDKLNKIAHIVGENTSFSLRLSEASSGFQSTVPLYLVTKYLSDRLTAEDDPSIQETSLEDQKKIDKEVKAIMEDPHLTHEVRQAYLRQVSAKRKPTCFINIVEEPEQNLFPTSQQSVLNELLKYANEADENKLIMTTHSPFMLLYLTLSVEANKIKARANTDDLKAKLNEIVPLHSTIDGTDLVVYELNEVNGTIEKLKDYQGLPSDENYLNNGLADSNDQFSKLLDLEDLCL